METLRLVWLQAFLKIAECESHSEAGRQLGWDQSTVSRYLKRLEKWLGKTLFTGLVPPVITEDGKAFLPVAKEVLQLLADSRTPKATTEKRPPSPALVKEHRKKIWKILIKVLPQPGTQAARGSGYSDEELREMWEEYRKLFPTRRTSTISGADIDMSNMTQSKKED